EISYTIRSFIEKIGLTPDHPQLQIIATSASLSSDDGQQFLGDFFGTDPSKKPFKIIDGPAVTPNPSGLKHVRMLSQEFEDLAALDLTEEAFLAWSTPYLWSS